MKNLGFLGSKCLASTLLFKSTRCLKNNSLKKTFMWFSQKSIQLISCRSLYRLKSSMADDTLYIGTSNRGITSEIKIEVPWGVVAAKTYGDVSGHPVLCIHGWLDNCNTFDSIIPFLPKDRFFVFIDLPGHGKSSQIPIGSFYTSYDYTALVERIRQYFSWSHFSLMSHSLGGNISAVYAGTFPEKVDKLILLDVLGVNFMNRTNEVVGVLRQSIESYLKHENDNRTPPNYTYEHAKSRLLKGNSSLTSHFADVILERGAAQREDGTYVFVRDFRHTLRNPTAVDLEKGIMFMNRIEAETIHILAKDSGIFSNVAKSPELSKAVDLILKAFTKCQLYKSVLVDGKHHVHLCNPENVIEHIRFMLDRPVRSALDNSATVNPANL